MDKVIFVLLVCLIAPILIYLKIKDWPYQAGFAEIGPVIASVFFGCLINAGIIMLLKGFGYIGPLELEQTKDFLLNILK